MKMWGGSAKIQPLVNLLKSPLFWRIAASLFLFAVFSMWAYNRYPVYWDVPNFYAEDGTIFAQNVIDKGFWGALFTSFNGYFIFGVYLLEGLAFLLNDLFFDGSLLDLSKTLGLVSYLFWAFLCTLPVLLFWHDVKRKFWLILLSVSLAVLPLPGFNYAVFTVGNLKFAFMYIAFLLLIKRWRLPSNSRWVYAIDASLVICAFTNATVYLLLPFALLPYWPGWKPLRAPITLFKSLLHNRGFISLLGLLVLVSLQILYIVLRGGIDHIEGYLQEPYEMAKTIEIFLHRTLLFPFDHMMVKDLSNSVVVLGTLVLIIGLWKIARREDRPIVIFGLWAALVTTALFVSQRTGTSHLFNNYTTSGPDHFFYTQNLIILFTAIYVICRRLDTFTNRRLVFGGAVLLCLIPAASLANADVGQGALNYRTIGSFRYAVQQVCHTTTNNPLQVPVYPTEAIKMPVDRDTYCNESAEQYIPDRQPLPLVPTSQYFTIGSDTLTQTFTANYNQLNGVSIFFATFGGGSPSKYKLVLMDAECQTTLRATVFSSLLLKDNAYSNVRFTEINTSKNVRYCFTIQPETLVPNTPPLAIRLGEPGGLPEETTQKNTQDLPEDVVFDVLYKPHIP